MSKSKLPTYKLTHNDDHSITVSSDNEKLIVTTFQRWQFMMNNCKAFIPDHLMDKHHFKQHRFLVTDLTEIVKVDSGDKYIYEFTAQTMEVPNTKSVFHAIRDHYTEHSHLVEKILKEGDFK